MPSRVQARFAGIEELRRDLESVRVGLGRELTAILRDEAQPLSAATAALTPRGPGPQGTKDDLPHVYQTIRGVATAAGMGVVSDHPAAPILEFAGNDISGATIAPRGVPITFHAHRMAQQAAEKELPAIEARLDARIAQLLARHGL